MKYDLDKLKFIMMKNNVTKKDIAEVLEAHRNTVYRKLAGKRDLTLNEAKDIADFFDMTVTDLFFSPIVTERNKKTG